MLINIALLQTCRRVYLEAHALPLLQKEHVLYLYRGPDAGLTWSHDARVRQYFSRKLGNPSPVPGFRQSDLVRSVRLFTQLFWLEDHEKFWTIVNDKPWFRPIETLRITLRRSDWWHWESNQPPIINPFKGTVTMAEMKADMLVEGGNPPFKPEACGSVSGREDELVWYSLQLEPSVHDLWSESI
ncbi:hypothetical protein DL769_009578 [Monosporascus sp. CRB-8-3]|nr:hypothetical protein DL769_009578 [Monosporascus sp. CRB-8-3]